MIKSNFKSFQAKLNKNINAKIKKRDDFVKGVIFSAYGEILVGMPKSTSYLAANTFIDFGGYTFRSLDGEKRPKDADRSKYAPITDKHESDAKAKIDEVNLSKIGSINIHNSLEYMDAIEEGHSKINKKMFYKATKRAKLKLKRGY